MYVHVYNGKGIRLSKSNPIYDDIKSGFEIPIRFLNCFLSWSAKDVVGKACDVIEADERRR